ncbi:MAG: PqqD family protein [Arenicellales bacterium]
MAEKNPKKNDDFQIEEIDGEALLYSPKATRSIYLNPSASIIWQLCTGEHSVSDITAFLQAQFPDAGAQVAQDVQSTIDQFLENEAITLV